MKYSLRTLLLLVFTIATLIAILIPIFRFSWHDSVSHAVQKLQNEGAVVIKLMDNGKWQGEYFCIKFEGVDTERIDIDAVKVVNPDVVDLSGTRWSDHDLPRLHDLSATQIDLRDTDVTLKGLETLKTILGKRARILSDLE